MRSSNNCSSSISANVLHRGTIKAPSRKTCRGRLTNVRSGLALSAGGARGAYQIGAWRAFLEKGVCFDAFSGSSIGALNSALICQGDWDRAYRLWMEIPKIRIVRVDVTRIAKLMFTIATDIGMMLAPIPNVRLIRFLRPLLLGIKFLSNYGIAGTLARDGLIDIRSFIPFVGQYLDISGLLHPKFTIYTCIYEAPRFASPLGATRFVRLQDLSIDEAWLLMAASSSLPFIFSTVDINKVRHIDGGIGSWLPLEPLVESGMRSVFAVCSASAPKTVCQASEKTSLTVIQPDQPLGRFPIATFGFQINNIERWMEMGYSDARKRLELI